MSNYKIPVINAKLMYDPRGQPFFIVKDEEYDEERMTCHPAMPISTIPIDFVNSI